MTLCIAAQAKHEGKTCLVLCSDTQIGDDYSTTEGTLKCDLTLDSSGMSIMFAGTMDHVQDALQVYRARLTSDPLTLTGYKQQLFDGFKDFKDGLLRRGEATTDVELLFAGFIEGAAKIIYVGQDRVIEQPFIFHVIGVGYHLADAMLRWRNPAFGADFYEVLYYVYEAKRIAESSPHVGKLYTNLIILERRGDGTFATRFLGSAALRHLDNDFKRFGPQRFDAVAEFPWSEVYEYPETAIVKVNRAT